MYLIVGLGNPGLRYAKTRHNVGFMMIDRIAAELGEKVEQLNGRSVVRSTRMAGREVLLAKPQTYMNLSGYAVQELLKWGHFELSQCLIIYDEVSLPLGKARIRPGGGSGGQRGIQSVLDVVGTKQIPRLRIGIAGDSMGDDLSRYVLDRFDKDELAAVEEVLGRCYSALEVLLSEGIDRAMALCN